MGVIRNLSSLGGSIDDQENGWSIDRFIENEVNDANQNHINNVQNELNNQAQEEEEEDLIFRQHRNRIRRLRDQRKRSGLKPQPTFRALGCRGTSYKKYRRYENGNQLISRVANRFQVEQRIANLLSQSIAKTSVGLHDDELLDDISIYDFVPQTVSAFTQLMMEAEKMQVIATAWNEFIAHSEEEQEFILDAVDNETIDNVYNICKKVKRDSKARQFVKRRSLPNHRTSTSSTASEESEAGTSRVTEKRGKDKRSTHPSYCAEECFERISHDIKALIRKRQVPLGLLSSIEEEITSFFSNEPLATYKSCLPSGYQRMLLHACCQYLDLSCQSFNKDGFRWSKVRNLNHFFERPEKMLSNYLEEQVYN